MLQLPLIDVLDFNDTSTLVGHFVSSPRKREKRDSRGDEREGQGWKRKRDEREEIKTFPLYPYLLQGEQALPNYKPISVGHPSDVRYTTPSPHLTTPGFSLKHSKADNLNETSKSFYKGRNNIFNPYNYSRGHAKIFFHISAQNINCGYSIELPHRGSSKVYPKSMFLSRNKKNNVYPCKPQFYYI